MTQYLPLSLSLAIRRSCACIAPSRDCVLSTCAHRMRRSDQSPRGGTRRPASTCGGTLSLSKRVDLVVDVVDHAVLVAYLLVHAYRDPLHAVDRRREVPQRRVLRARADSLRPGCRRDAAEITAEISLRCA